MIDCMDCMNYKTKVVTDGKDSRADTMLIQKAVRENGAAKIFFCTHGNRNHSSLKPSLPMKRCRNYESVEDKVLTATEALSASSF